jgi:simple sugar transport system ATP-binding protein
VSVQIVAPPWRVEAVGIHKSFGAVQALRGVDLRVAPGEVLGLLGDNGAGKSTLIKILTGVHAPDAGELRWDGDLIRMRSPADAVAMGITVVFQDLAVVDQMSIYRNMFLGRERAVSRRLGPLQLFHAETARRLSRQALADVGLGLRDVNKPVLSLSGGERQSIAVARAIHFQSKLLILDEPTSALSVKESRKVLSFIGQAKAAGVAVIVITHNIHTIHPIADRVMVLARGQTVGEFPEAGSTELPTPDQIGDLIVETSSL